MAPDPRLAAALLGLQPILHDGTFVFVTLSPGADPRPYAPVAMVHEPEGLSIVVREQAAARHGLAAPATAFRAAWITLAATTDLDLVGLTATVAQALASAGIACNVVAGARHDHLFVPVARARDALAVLAGLAAPPA